MIVFVRWVLEESKTVPQVTKMFVTRKLAGLGIEL